MVSYVVDSYFLSDSILSDTLNRVQISDNMNLVQSIEKDPGKKSNFVLSLEWSINEDDEFWVLEGSEFQSLDI